MDTERARAELRRLLDELPEDRKSAWRSTVDDIGDAYGATMSENRDLRAATDLAGAIRESTATLATANEVLREAKAELGRRVIIPDAATWAKLGVGITTIAGPIGAAIAYFASGGTTPLPTLPGSGP